MINPVFLQHYPFSPPALPDNDLNILNFGAVGDGKHLNTSALQKAIDTCSAKGGGKVTVPKGNFLTGTFSLKSNVHLFLEEGGVILGSPYMKDYTDIYDGMYGRRSSPFKCLVHACNQSKVMISGKGAINGNAQIGGTGEFRDTGNNDMRPPLFLFENCTDLTIKEITFRQSLMWTAIFDHCQQVWVDRVKIIENYFYNADGIDILDCVDFLIENCDINTDDDGICLKSNARGCDRVIVRNNRVRSLCNAFKMGTSSTGGFKNVLIENNEAWQTVISGIALQIVDGGVMDNVVIKNMVMNGVGTPISIRLGDRSRSGKMKLQTGIIRNVHISDIKATVSKAIKYNEAERHHHDYAPYPSTICGLPGCLIENVTIENVSITMAEGFPTGTSEELLREIPENPAKYPENRVFGALPAYGFYVRHAREIQFKNITIITPKEDSRPAFVFDDVHNAKCAAITATSARATPMVSVKAGCSNIRIG
jgi:polygalacturonase